MPSGALSAGPRQSSSSGQRPSAPCRGGAVGRTEMTAAHIRKRLRALANKDSIPALRRFFKTAPGEYGESDLFLGVSLPQLRTLCRECRGIAQSEVTSVLRSRFHEERLLALLILVDA